MWGRFSVVQSPPSGYFAALGMTSGASEGTRREQQQLSYGFDGSDGLVAETAFHVDGLIKNGLRTPQRPEAVPIKSHEKTMNAVSATNPSIPSDP